MPYQQTLQSSQHPHKSEDQEFGAAIGNGVLQRRARLTKRIEQCQRRRNAQTGKSIVMQMSQGKTLQVDFFYKA